MASGEITDQKMNSSKPGLGRYLSPLSVWALSFGCAVGWGSFVMPGTTFLPQAGPAGTVIGILLGAAVMFIIGMNYHYLMNKFPHSGGTLTYTAKLFGYDHGFLSAWFLILVYVAIMWANATALALIVRNLFGGLFQFGFHYRVLEYDIYFGEILITIAVILFAGLLCAFSDRLSVFIQVLGAIALFGGIIIASIAVFRYRHSLSFTPAYSPGRGSSFRQIFTIIALSPWAYVGFESISNSAEGFKFPVKKSLLIMSVALLTSAVSYIALALIAVSVIPRGYSDWTAYIADIGNLSGSASLPTFYAVRSVMGKSGTVILGIAAMSGIITGLIGNCIACSRLMYAMAEDKILPSWFSVLSSNGTPRNAFLFLTLISLFIPFLGRTAIGWIVDVNTVGATIAYGYTSASAFACARRDKNKPLIVTGAAGLVMSVVFFLYFMAFSSGTMATESYLILATWSILGFVYFRIMFGHDSDRRFGKSTIVWIGLLFLIFFTSLMWIRQATDEMSRKVIGNISTYYEELYEEDDSERLDETGRYLNTQIALTHRQQARNSMIQMGLIVFSLGIMFSIYRTMSSREKQMETEKIHAEESSMAKSVFLSNMSHDIRTPMNAIVGYVNLAERDFDDRNKVRDYISKIKTSSRHLLALINDVLEMSRIESGRMDLELIPVDLVRTVHEVGDMFSTQMAEKKIAFVIDTGQVTETRVRCDRNRLNRVLLNLISNAWKFTPEGGKVTVRLTQIPDEDITHGTYELRVSDTGIGMSKEFAEKVFDAFERENNSTVSGIQGTGLGMAITKSIVELMGGSIEVLTASGEGTEFIIHLRFEYADDGEPAETDDADHIMPDTGVTYFSGRRILVAEDMDINRELVTLQLTGLGFEVETAVDGREALDKVTISSPGYYDAVLMDIQMPVMDGYEATHQIRALPDEELSGIPIIALSANAFSEDVRMALDAGMNAHIAKPIDIDILAQTLTDILGTRKKQEE